VKNNEPILGPLEKIVWDEMNHQLPTSFWVTYHNDKYAIPTNINQHWEKLLDD